MGEIGRRLVWESILGVQIPMGGINPRTVVYSWMVMAAIFIISRLIVRRLSEVPGRAQVVLEMFVGAFDSLVSESLELPTARDNRKYLALIASLFIFLIISNMLGFLPGTELLYLVVHGHDGEGGLLWFFSEVEEPTADINTTLGLGIMGFCIAIYSGIRAKGVLKWFLELFEPLPWYIPLFFPLNVVGELAKIVSISFRLFGNIIGGSIILLIVSNLIYYFLLPVPLDFFFIFFVGAVQAFVFTILTLTYITVAIK